jgi:hypothetical protein
MQNKIRSLQATPAAYTLYRNVHIAAAANAPAHTYNLPAALLIHPQEQQLASVKKLSRAEEQLSAVKAQRPGSTLSQKAAMQQRLQEATQEVQAAAAAAQKASQQLEIVAAEKDKVQQELHAIRQQLEAAPLAKQHADLYSKLAVSCTTSCMLSLLIR